MRVKNPKNEKILVVSASSVKAKEFVAQAKGILKTFDLLRFLRPKEDQRNSFDRFDVRQASLSQSPSLKAAGITGQITGSRATRIIADDIEIEGDLEFRSGSYGREDPAQHLGLIDFKAIGHGNHAARGTRDRHAGRGRLRRRDGRRYAAEVPPGAGLNPAIPNARKPVNGA